MSKIYLNDDVYVFENRIIAKLDINKKNVGKVINIQYSKETDNWGDNDFNCFKVTILLENNKRIIIEDNFTRIFFRKYEFIKISEFKELLSNNKKVNEILKNIKEFSNA